MVERKAGQFQLAFQGPAASLSRQADALPLVVKALAGGIVETGLKARFEGLSGGAGAVEGALVLYQCIQRIGGVERVDGGLLVRPIAASVKASPAIHAVVVEQDDCRLCANVSFEECIGGLGICPIEYKRGLCQLLVDGVVADVLNDGSVAVDGLHVLVVLAHTGATRARAASMALSTLCALGVAVDARDEFAGPTVQAKALSDRVGAFVGGIVGLAVEEAELLPVARAEAAHPEPSGLVAGRIARCSDGALDVASIAGHSELCALARYAVADAGLVVDDSRRAPLP